MEIYRVEYYTGSGFFVSGGSFYYNEISMEEDEKHNCNVTCPLPSDDSPAIRDFFQYEHDELAEKYFFGFNSIDDLLKVFPSFAGREKCHKENYHICVYTVDEKYVVNGRMQCIFMKNKAVLTKKMCFHTFDEIEN